MIYDISNNFIDLVKLITEFYPILREHLSQVLNKTQNEFIHLIASHVKSKIIEKVLNKLNNKYYAIILGCIQN